eukprot:Tamp_14614.p1 GENE.Tamp_14614~~Tamp_14614.p1  ORF type:complete len:271 (-),score=32.44 Tamp_14614:286-1098(-)
MGCDATGAEQGEGSTRSACSIDLLGRFQSFRYFAHAEQEVRRTMQIRPALKQRAARVVEHVRALFRSPDAPSEGGPRVVSIHVRRGDNVPEQRAAIYADWRKEAPQLYGQEGDNQAPHLLLTGEYIERAIAQIQHDLWCGAEGCVYLVFADTERDIDWCRQHLPARLRVRFFSEFVPLVATWDKGAMVKGSGKRVAALTDVLDLAGIAACDAHIMSTSSFSWWGAYLNDKPQKRVVVPTPWFNPAHPMGDAITDTMHPPDWIPLPLNPGP